MWSFAFSSSSLTFWCNSRDGVFSYVQWCLCMCPHLAGRARSRPGRDCLAERACNTFAWFGFCSVHLLTTLPPFRPASGDGLLKLWDLTTLKVCCRFSRTCPAPAPPRPRTPAKMATAPPSSAPRPDLDATHAPKPRADVERGPGGARLHRTHLCGLLVCDFRLGGARGLRGAGWDSQGLLQAHRNLPCAETLLAAASPPTPLMFVRHPRPATCAAARISTQCDRFDTSASLFVRVGW